MTIIPHGAMRAAYDALGLEAGEYQYTTRIVMLPDGVVVERLAHDDAGMVRWDGPGAVIERRKYPVAWAEPDVLELVLP